MAIEQRHHAHPVVKAGVIGAAALLAVVFAMSAVSLVAGFVWLVIKVVLIVGLVAGMIHLGRHFFRHA